MSFKTIYDQYHWGQVQEDIHSKTAADVRRALQSPKRTLEDFKALISPAASPYLEEMAQQSRALSQKRFGKTIQLFAPLYLSNECNNICTYCGFSRDNQIKRKTLTAAEILLEIAVLKQQGFQHLLLVTGEANHTVHVDYFLKAIALLKTHFAQLSIEVQPLSAEEYQHLQAAGVHSVLVYQETYHKDCYKSYHPKGKKANFYYRLDTPDRVGRSGMHKIGLGVLLGLEDWRTDSFFCALHLEYLQKEYWQSKYTLSFPRLRPAIGVSDPAHPVSDAQLLQLICAYRLLYEELELSLSTREPEALREHLMQLGVTSMSAGSKTNPGGYAVAPDALEQFKISDERSAQQVAEQIRQQGYQAVWKDWDKSFCV